MSDERARSLASRAADRALLGARRCWPLRRPATSASTSSSRSMIFAIFALSLELLVGTTGLVSLGHAAFFGIGALRRGARCRREAAAASLLWLLPAGDAARRRCTRCSSARCRLRTKGVYFIMVTLAFAQMAFFVFHDTTLGGGSDGIYLYVKPVLALGSRRCSTWTSRCALLLLRARRAGRAPSACSRCCCARASAARWPASASTSSACAPPASRPSATSSRPS